MISLSDSLFNLALFFLCVTRYLDNKNGETAKRNNTLVKEMTHSSTSLWLYNFLLGFLGSLTLSHIGSLALSLIVQLCICFFPQTLEFKFFSWLFGNLLLDFMQHIVGFECYGFAFADTKKRPKLQNKNDLRNLSLSIFQNGTLELL